MQKPDPSSSSNNPSESIIWDVAIIGAGAAGLMAAIRASREGLKHVLLLDGREKIGAKILMSGGTRCNLTNQKVTENDFESEFRRTVRHVLEVFSSEKAVEFFEELGVDVVLEPGGKFFPFTHSARTVLEALVHEAERCGVKLQNPRKIIGLQFRDNAFLLSGEGFQYEAKNVILSTGGLSYPTTGSDGTGYGLAQSFGHSLVPTTPALTPLQTGDEDWKSLAGVTLPVRLSLWVSQKKQAVFEGSFLFTHFGFSGPAVLNISRHWLRERKDRPVKLAANFLPSWKEEDFRNDFLKTIQTQPNQLLKRFLTQELPERFVDVFLRKAGISDSVILNQLKRETREELIRSLFSFPLNVTGAVGYQKAEATAGGVDLKEVNPKTLESKLQPGLFFAGEILDVDGRIGGFNFQWAWSSGVVAARGVQKIINSKF